MMTALPLRLHHAVTALIRKVGTVVTEVLTSRLAHFTSGNDPGTYSIRYWVDVRTGLHVYG